MEKYLKNFMDFYKSVCTIKMKVILNENISESGKLLTYYVIVALESVIWFLNFFELYETFKWLDKCLDGNCEKTVKKLFEKNMIKFR